MTHDELKTAIENLKPSLLERDIDPRSELGRASGEDYKRKFCWYQCEVRALKQGFLDHLPASEKENRVREVLRLITAAN